MRQIVRPRALLAAVVICASAALLACGGGSDDDNATTTPLPSVESILEASATKMQAVRTLHFVFEHEHGSTVIVRKIAMTSATGDVVAPDRMQANIEGSLGPVNFKAGMILIGPDAWLQNPLTQRWESDSITIDQVFDPQQGVVALMRGAPGAELKGVEKVDGVNCYRVEVTLDSSKLELLPGEPEPGHSVLTVAWIGVEDSLARRIELRGPVAASESQDIVRRISFSKFDQDVTIVAPR